MSAGSPGSPPSAASAPPAPAEERLPLRLKLGFAWGDHTINVSLGAQSLFLLYFLTQVAGLRPALASAVVLAGRAVDAFTDPAMGRFSDLTRTRFGRRRPYFLLGALPFGLSFAWLWQPTALDSQLGLFAVYASAYVLHTLASTVLAVPYMALLPEMAVGYQERTAVNVYRHAAAILGTLLVAVSLQALVESFGGGAAGYARVGVLFGIWITLPWALVFGVTFERPRFARPARIGFVEGARRLARHVAYRRLVGLFLAARIAVDVVAAMFVFYFAFWLRRPGDYPITLGLMLLSVVAALPFWLRVSRSLDKRTVFTIGACWWIGAQAALWMLGPESPRLVVFAVAVLAGFGYAVADLMPWSMLGDVIDEDELATGERREGVYAGFFTFLRKLGGAAGVALAGLVLEAVGFQKGAEPTAEVLGAIRGLTALAPAFFLLIAIQVARGYPLGRARHAAIRRELEARRSDTAAAD